jgi:hypothetical protein
MEYYNYRKNNNNLISGVVSNPRECQIYRFYKLLCAYKLMINYENNNNIKHDYIAICRPDSIFHDNLNKYMHLLETSKKLLIH